MPVHPKVKAGTIAAAVSGIIVWLLGRYVLHGHVDATVTAEVYAAVPALLTFAAGWLTPAKAAVAAPVTLHVTAGTQAQDAGRQIVEALRAQQVTGAAPAPGSAAAETVVPPAGT